MRLIFLSRIRAQQTAIMKNKKCDFKARVDNMLFLSHVELGTDLDPDQLLKIGEKLLDMKNETLGYTALHAAAYQGQ